jgi:hypothetical protein
VFLVKKWGILIKKESGDLVFIDLEIYKTFKGGSL